LPIAVKKKNNCIAIYKRNCNAITLRNCNPQ
jgi:hypothetical protein